MSNRLPVLKGHIADLHREIRNHTVTAAEKALSAGAALVEARALCGHGQWGPWLREVGVSERTAQRYMLLHKAGCKPAIVADLGWSQAERLCSLGRKIWPRDGFGFEAVGANGDGAFVYVLTLPHEDGTATYWASYLFQNRDQDFWLTRRCGTPVAMGLLWEGVEDHFDLTTFKMMNPEQTKSAWDEVIGRAA